MDIDLSVSSSPPAASVSLCRPETAASRFSPDACLHLIKASKDYTTQLWGKLETHQSLVFYYCNQGNSLDESASRIIVSVGRIEEVGPQLYFGTTPKIQDQYPVWSRCITDDFLNQGVRIRYQEYLRQVLQTDGIVCRVPLNALLPVSNGGEHVSDGTAVVILERVIQCVERVAGDGRIAGDWERRLAWLNDVLAEPWHERGPFPGAGSVLQ